MVSMRFNVVENGLETYIDEYGYEAKREAKGTKGQKIFINYVLLTDTNVNYFVSDMLKFELPSKPGKPLLADTQEEAKKYFKSTSLLLGALEIIAMKSRIYIMVQSKERKDDPKTIDKKYNLISWKRAAQLELV